MIFEICFWISSFSTGMLGSWWLCSRYFKDRDIEETEKLEVNLDQYNMEHLVHMQQEAHARMMIFKERLVICEENLKPTLDYDCIQEYIKASQFWGKLNYAITQRENVVGVDTK